MSPFWKLPVGGTGNGVAGGGLGEDVHRQALVLGAVLIDDPLGDAHHLQLRHAGADFPDHLLGGQLGDAVSLPQAGNLALRLDGAQLHHDVAGVDDFRLGEGLPDGIHNGHRGVQVRGDAQAQLLPGDANGPEDVVEGVGLELRIRGVGALPVGLEDEDLVQLVPVAAELPGLGAHHQRRVAGGGDGHAAPLKQRPETGKIPGVGVVGLVGVDNQGVEAPAAQNGGRPLDALFVLVVGDANSTAHVDSPFPKV